MRAALEAERPRRSRWRVRIASGLIALLVLPHLVSAALVAAGDVEHWSRARWDSAGLAPDAASTPEAVIQVYAARAWSWKGAFGVHTWIALKPEGAARFTRYEVVGWGVSRGRPAVRENRHVVDGYWAGNPPALLLDRRGPEAAALMGRIETAIAAYPFIDRYVTWPGPNSNTFIAHIGRAVPELGLELPPTAIGKDYTEATLLLPTPSGTGWQLSLLGVLGVAVARAEGLELNLLGFTIGLDPGDLAVKLPGVGLLGLG